jgi:hypothetical protein
MTISNRIFVATAAVALSLAGCASRPDNIAASYVSPNQYGSYTCKQLEEEAQRVSSRAAEAAGVQQSKATGDAVATTVALVVFWPALFLIQGDGANAAEVARLKGEMEAIESASVQKKCGIQFNHG